MSSPLNYTPRRRVIDPALSHSLARDDVNYADEADRQAREIERQRNPLPQNTPGSGVLTGAHDWSAFDKAFPNSANSQRDVATARAVTGAAPLPIGTNPVASAVQQVANTVATPLDRPRTVAPAAPQMANGDLRRVETQYAPRDSSGNLAPVTGTVRQLPASAPGFINGVQTDGAPVAGMVQGGTQAKERIAQYGTGGAPVAPTVAASLPATPAPTSGPMDLPSGIKPFNAAVADAPREQQVFGKPLSATSDLSNAGKVYPSDADIAGQNIRQALPHDFTPIRPEDKRPPGLVRGWEPGTAMPTGSDYVSDVVKSALNSQTTSPSSPTSIPPSTPVITRPAVPEAQPAQNSIAGFGSGDPLSAKPSVPAVVPPSQDDELRRRQVASNQ